MSFDFDHRDYVSRFKTKYPDWTEMTTRGVCLAVVKGTGICGFPQQHLLPAMELLCPNKKADTIARAISDVTKKVPGVQQIGCMLLYQEPPAEPVVAHWPPSFSEDEHLARFNLMKDPSVMIGTKQEKLLEWINKAPESLVPLSDDLVLKLISDNPNGIFDEGRKWTIRDPFRSKISCLLHTVRSTEPSYLWLGLVGVAGMIVPSMAGAGKMVVDVISHEVAQASNLNIDENTLAIPDTRNESWFSWFFGHIWTDIKAYAKTFENEDGTYSRISAISYVPMTLQEYKGDVFFMPLCPHCLLTSASHQTQKVA